MARTPVGCVAASTTLLSYSPLDGGTKLLLVGEDVP